MVFKTSSRSSSYPRQTVENMAHEQTATSPRAQRRLPSLVDSDELAQKLQQQLSLGCTTISRTMENDLSNPPTPEGRDLAPANFAVVAPGIYRSSYPSDPHYTKLADLELKTIVTLVPEPLPFSYANFISSNGISHHHIPILANKDENKYTEAATVNKIMELLLDRENYPILIHCNKGKHRTGCMTACFRKITGWTDEACISEYVHYSTPKERTLDKAFIRRYDAEVLKGVALERKMVGAEYSMNLQLPRNDTLKSSDYTVKTTNTVDTTTTNGTQLGLREANPNGMVIGSWQ